jgi:TorA maturation chaperone TorD
MEPVMNDTNTAGWFAAYAPIRRDCYVMLASFLAQAPSGELIGILQNLQWDDAIPAKLDRALGRLRQAASDCAIAGIEAEFSRLFVGMGCGEMVPYASWYRKRMIQSSPLASLRADLIRLGITKQADSFETEDHAGAMCEVMALLSAETNGAPHAVQAEFFAGHVGPWMTGFFKDLRSANHIEFYRAVATFGICLLEAEGEYLNSAKDIQIPIPKGGLHNEERNDRQPADVH